MMEHFNELNTQGVDRDEALSLAIESEKTRDFTELKGEVAVGLSSGTSGHRGGSLSQQRKSEVCGLRLSWQRCCPRAAFLTPHRLFPES